MHAYKASFLAFAISVHLVFVQLMGPCGLKGQLVHMVISIDVTRLVFHLPNV